MRKLIMLFSFLCFAVLLKAQDYESFQKNYENGKELFKLKRYGLAMQAFKPLTSSFNENPFIKYASYYYAVSAFYEKQYDISAAMLHQIKKLYPDWDQMDEVNLWLAKIYLKKNDYSKAVATVNEIENQDKKKYGNKLLLNGLEKVTSYDSLNALYQQYPDNKIAGESLAHFISKQPLVNQDRTLLFDLIDKFDLKTETLNLLQATDSEKKDAYKMAVLLPFMYKDLKSNRNNIRNQFVIDLYQGMLLGQDELKTLNINLDLFSYDTESSKEKTEKILKLPALQHVDLIYGPLYPFPVLLANQFSFDYQINMFNPLSSNQQVIGNNPYSFLYMPTNDTQGKACAEYILKKTKIKKNGMIFYGTDEKDSVLAYSFANTFYEAGDSSIYIKKIEENKSKKIIEILNAGSNVELEPGEEKSSSTKLFKIRRDSLGFVFIASESPAIASSAITAMETRGDSTVLIGKESWLNSQIISYDALERLKTILIAPTYIDYSSNSYQYFETLYKEKFNTLPSKNACIGYETVLLLGKLLNKYGNHFENEFDTESIKGSLFQRYTLNGKNSNQYVPLVRFKEAELKLLNP